MSPLHLPTTHTNGVVQKLIATPWSARVQQNTNTAPKGIPGFTPPIAFRTGPSPLEQVFFSPGGQVTQSTTLFCSKKPPEKVYGHCRCGALYPKTDVSGEQKLMDAQAKAPRALSTPSEQEPEHTWWDTFLSVLWSKNPIFLVLISLPINSTRTQSKSYVINAPSWK